MAWLKWFAPERSRLREAATDEGVGRLRESGERAVRRSRRALVSVTTEVDVADPCAAVFASRLASDRWFCWEQPDREFALAGLGVGYEGGSRGGGRFADIAEECLRTGRDAILDEPRGLPAGAGPAWRGGFAIDSEGGASSPWSSLPPGSLVLPELSLCCSGERAFLTLNAVIQPGEDVEERSAALAARLAGGRAEAPPAVLAPHPNSA